MERCLGWNSYASSNVRRTRIAIWGLLALAACDWKAPSPKCPATIAAVPPPFQPIVGGSVDAIPLEVTNNSAQTATSFWPDESGGYFVLGVQTGTGAPWVARFAAGGARLWERILETTLPIRVAAPLTAGGVVILASDLADNVTEVSAWWLSDDGTITTKQNVTNIQGLSAVASLVDGGLLVAGETHLVRIGADHSITWAVPLEADPTSVTVLSQLAARPDGSCVVSYWREAPPGPWGSAVPARARAFSPAGASIWQQDYFGLDYKDATLRAEISVAPNGALFLISRSETNPNMGDSFGGDWILNIDPSSGNPMTVGFAMEWTECDNSNITHIIPDSLGNLDIVVSRLAEQGDTRPEQSSFLAQIDSTLVAKTAFELTLPSDSLLGPTRLAPNCIGWLDPTVPIRIIKVATVGGGCK